MTRCRDAGIRLRDGAFQNLVRHNVVATNGTSAGATGLGDGIGLEDADLNRVEGNRSVGNVDDGLFADAASSANTIVGNTMDANGIHDCHDDSSGSRTAGTANVWSSNRGDTQNRAGLCRRHGNGGDGDGDGADRNGKVTICHKGHAIRVSKNALPAHKRHGDTVGACTGRDDAHGDRDDDDERKGKHKGDKHKADKHKHKGKKKDD